jgi:hypothetical protein
MFLPLHMQGTDTEESGVRGGVDEQRARRILNLNNLVNLEQYSKKM